MQRRFLPCLILLVAFAIRPCDSARAADRISISGTINGQPIRFIYDTGAEASGLFRKSAQRLGITIIPQPDDAPAPPPGKVSADVTADCTVAFGDQPVKRPFLVIDDAPYLHQDFDGILSWTEVNLGANQVLLFDGGKHFMSSIPLPADIKKWSKWKIVPDLPFLVFECPDGNEMVRIGIDTGDDGGVLLNADRWQQWLAARAGQPATLYAGWHPADGLVVSEVMRARKITLGGLTLGDVPVSAASHAAGINFAGCDAILGLFALSKVQLIIDRNNGVIYTRLIANSSSGYDYNRLGAVFVPQDLQASNDLTAHVVDGSVASQAGIRNDDVLLKIGDLDVTQWRTNPKVLPLSRFWSQPPGTILKLSLKHNDQPYEVTVTLKDPAAVD
jgi:hypothetical protein